MRELFYKIKIAVDYRKSGDESLRAKGMCLEERIISVPIEVPRPARSFLQDYFGGTSPHPSIDIRPNKFLDSFDFHSHPGYILDRKDGTLYKPKGPLAENLTYGEVENIFNILGYETFRNILGRFCERVEPLSVMDPEVSSPYTIRIVPCGYQVNNLGAFTVREFTDWIGGGNAQIPRKLSAEDIGKEQEEILRGMGGGLWEWYNQFPNKNFHLELAVTTEEESKILRERLIKSLKNPPKIASDGSLVDPDSAHDSGAFVDIKVGCEFNPAYRSWHSD